MANKNDKYELGEVLVHIKTKELVAIIEIIEWPDGDKKYILMPELGKNTKIYSIRKDRGLGPNILGIFYTRLKNGALLYGQR